MQNFINWLIEEMNKRGWSNSELARQAGVSQAMVSLIINGDRQPGTDFCLGMSRAFKVPPEQVFRRGGLLPDRDGIEEELFKRLRDYVEGLSPQRREELMRYVMFLYQLEADREKENNPTSGEEETDEETTEAP